MPDDADPAERRSRAIAHRRAYERLKLLMDSQKRIADELMFQRLELRCREAEAPGAFRVHHALKERARRLLNVLPVEGSREAEAAAWRDTRDWTVTRVSRAFGVLSDYGWDPVRPALWLLGVVLAGGLLIFGAEMVDYPWLGWPDCTAWTGPPGACPQPEYLGVGQSLSLSVSNVLGFLGLSRTFLREEVVTLTAVSEVVSAVQTVAGLVLLFLFGLALRNRFRIK